jgi:hypothetical protein
MKKPTPLIVFLCLCFLLSCNSEPTAVAVGDDATSTDAKPEKKDRNMFGHHIPRGLTKTSENLAPGYVLFTPHNSALIYLINRSGEVVYEWKSNYEIMGAYLQDDGSLFANASDPDFPVFAGGGQTGRLQHISKESKILWDFEYANERYHAHHDFAVMPNGHVLAIAWEDMSAEEALRNGRRPDYIPKAGVWPDKIIELEPQGKYGAKVVWEWHVKDHLIQNHDPKKANYGDPAKHPELLDFNVGRPMPSEISQDSMDILHKMGKAWRNQTVENRGSDIYHFNAINYNPELDQIAVSSPNLSEILIIDHSTTTKEAASHRGGRWGKGGDLLYRWGNPQNYSQGDSTHQQLFHQHDVRWIEAGKPGAGHLTIYNNEVPNGPDSMEYSAVYEIDPPKDAKGNYVLGDDNRFGPAKPFWAYVAPDTVSFYGGFISGAHRMKNGNTFINEGPRGRFFEVTPEGEIVWEYLNPYRGQIRKPNGDEVSPIPMAYIQFRSTFIPADHPAINVLELKPLDPQPEAFKLPPPPEKKEES